MDRSVLLLALSGVRIHDRELLDLGMSLPGFAERGATIAALPSLGLLTLAGCTPADWLPEYREIDRIDDEAVERIVLARPDLVAISALGARIFEAYRLADRLRAEGIRVVLGGLHVSALPDEAAAHADAVVVGEAESSWPELLRDAAAGRLRPKYEARAFPLVSLADAPLPRYDLVDPARTGRLTLQTTRGCPLHCTFCAASRTISPFKLKPIPQVRRELEALLAVRPDPFVELADDNTFVNQAWSRELVRLFSEYSLRWFTETDISVADDDELLDLLAESRCAQLLIGFESARPESLRGIDTANWKYGQFESYVRKIEKIQSRGISVDGCFVLGFDADDASTFEATRTFVRESGLTEVQVTLLTPFPGTDLYRELRRQGRLLEEVFWDRCTLFDVTFRPARMSPEDLRTAYLDLVRDLYSPAETEARRRRARAMRRAAWRERGA